MNQQYLFYIDYYNYEKKAYNNKNKDMTENARYSKSDRVMPLTGQSFVLQTVYPGSLAGIGYMHEWGKMKADSDDSDSNEEIKLGFSLDYVTGLPFIPGSTIKGILKSCFEKYANDISELLSDDENHKCTEEILADLKKRIFGDDETKTMGEDVFLDAFPIAPDQNSRVLGIDCITSHRSKEGPEYDGLTDPNPVKMLKILPGVSILFRFVLKDTIIYKKNDRAEIKLSANTKKNLFKKLLCDYGVGAKTNVGYGRLIETTEQEKLCWLQTEVCEQKSSDESEEAVVQTQKSKSNTTYQNNNNSGYEIDSTYYGIVKGHNKSGYYAWVKMDDGCKTSFWDGGRIKENTRVELKYCGKKEGHHEWQFVTCFPRL